MSCGCVIPGYLGPTARANTCKKRGAEAWARQDHGRSDLNKNLFLLAATAALAAGCATQNTAPADGAGGRHLVYRDGSGNVIRQFDYPDEAFCRRVEAMAGRAARCQATPAAGMQARATLRYNPPGVLVEGHYATMERCRTDNGTMSAGVQLINPCTPK